jgi:Polysaccharide lyase
MPPEGRDVMSRRITTALSAALTLVLATGIASGGANAPGQKPPKNLTPPSVSGVARVSNTFSSSTGTWQGKGLKYGYQWLRCDSAGASCGAISGATGSTKTLTTADVSYTLRVIVTATNRNGSAAATSAQTAVVAPAATAPPPPPPPPPSTNVPPSNETLPTVSGTAQQGQTLTASTGSWSGTTPMTYSYTWQRCGAGGASCAPIAGATSASYVLAAADVGSTLRVSVTASNSAGSATAASNATAVVGVLPSPSSPSGCGTGFYFCWPADPLSGGYWRSEPSPINSYFSQYDENTGVGSKVVRFKIDSAGGHDTGWGWKTALEGYRIFDGREPSSHAGQGRVVWYRLVLRLPCGQYFGSPEDTAISHLAWHSNSSNPNMPTGAWNTFFGVRGSFGSGNERFVLVRRAGQMASSSPYTPAVNEYDELGGPGSIQCDHWYNIVARFDWEGTSSGQVDLYIDGSLVYSNHATPTLLVAPNGYVDQPDIDLQLYRRKDVLTTTYTDFALAAAGPTQASVGS